MEKNPIIYLIDDDRPTNIYNEIILNKFKSFDSYRIFDDPKDAVEALKDISEKPHLIFVDINMPRMNGWEFVETIEKSLPDLHPPFVIVMLSTSLSHHDKDREKTFERVKGILEKPLTVKKLKEVIDDHIHS